MNNLSKHKSAKELDNEQYTAQVKADIESRRKQYEAQFTNEMPPTLLDDDIADWEHDNLESK